MLVVLVVASMGLWGCAQGPANNGAAQAERIRALEVKSAKLEDDFRAAVAVREQLRKKLTQAEEQRAQLGQQVEQLQNAVRERDELRQQLSARTGERDNLQTQFEQLRKGIRSLLGQADGATTSGPALQQPVTAADAEVSARKS
jgi:chromosome segregation ATPase